MSFAGRTVEGPGYRLFEGDALEALPLLAPRSVDAVVTSPPYADVIPRSLAVKPEDYAAWFSPFARELLRVLAPGAGMMLNLGRVFRGGRDVPVAERTMLRLLDEGWVRIDSIVWVQTNGRPIGGGYLCDCHEHVYWLAPEIPSGPKADYRGYTAETRRPHQPETLARYGRRFVQRYTKGSEGEAARRAVPNPDGALPDSVYVGPIGVEKGNPHPSPMDPAFARWLVALACPPGGVVLDPFAGSGNVGREALRSGRSFVGVELNGEWFDVMAGRVAGEHPTALAL